MWCKMRSYVPRWSLQLPGTVRKEGMKVTEDQLLSVLLGNCICALANNYIEKLKPEMLD